MFSSKKLAILCSMSLLVVTGFDESFAATKKTGANKTAPTKVSASALQKQKKSSGKACYSKMTARASSNCFNELNKISAFSSASISKRR